MRLLRYKRGNGRLIVDPMIDQGRIDLCRVKATPEVLDYPTVTIMLSHSRSERRVLPQMFELELSPTDVFVLVRMLIRVYIERGIKL